MARRDEDRRTIRRAVETLERDLFNLADRVVDINQKLAHVDIALKMLGRRLSLLEAENDKRKGRK